MNLENGKFRIETELDLRKMAAFLKAGARRVEFVFGKEFTQEVLATLEAIAQEIGTVTVELEADNEFEVLRFGLIGMIGGAAIGGAVGGLPGAAIGAAVGGVGGAFCGGMTVRILGPLSGPDSVLSLA